MPSTSCVVVRWDFLWQPWEYEGCWLGLNVLLPSLLPPCGVVAITGIRWSRVVALFLLFFGLFFTFFLRFFWPVLPFFAFCYGCYCKNDIIHAWLSDLWSLILSSLIWLISDLWSLISDLWSDLSSLIWVSDALIRLTCDLISDDLWDWLWMIYAGSEFFILPYCADCA